MPRLLPRHRLSGDKSTFCTRYAIVVYNIVHVTDKDQTDTHGWLEGHLKEQNYGADWGDYVSFTKHMKKKASKLGVDLIMVDTGMWESGLRGQDGWKD